MLKPTNSSLFVRTAAVVALFVVPVAFVWGANKTDVNAINVAKAHGAKVELKNFADPITKRKIVFTNINEPTSAHCIAGSKIADTKSLGGFGASDNVPKTLNQGVQGDGVYLVADPQGSTSGGVRVFLINKSRQMLAFRACDSRLYVVQQAQQADGTWRSIEYPPTSFCGNSYHRVILPVGQYWEMNAARYQGEIITKMRFAMILGSDERIYSNEFDGSVNVAQFVVPAKKASAK